MHCHRSIAATVLAAALLMPTGGVRAHDESKYSDWSGQWSRAPDGGVPRYDPTKPIRKQEAPLTPEYRARHEASMKDQDSGGFGLDLAYACIPQGMPRQMSGISAMEFAFAPDVTRILFEYTTMAPRRIYTEGRDWPKNPDPTFVGYSIGKWLDTDGDGRFDTLEAETRHIRGPRTWDQTGMPMGDDNDTIIKERFYLDKANPNILINEITTIDGSLTEPWSVLKKYRRSGDMVWVEYNCTEGNSYITLNKQVYYLSGDGKLMPMWKGQPPPDLSYFPQQNQ
jgi:hypothetical protein